MIEKKNLNASGNRVWIELDRRAYGTQEEINATNRARAALASQMLQRLGAEPNFVEWLPKENRYCFGNTTYVVANEDGHWFNLDYFASKTKNNASENKIKKNYQI